MHLISHTTHIRFATEVSPPSATRCTRTRIRYPRVAQIKGNPDRKASHDLFWRWGKLSSVPVDVSHSADLPAPILTTHPPRRISVEQHSTSATKGRFLDLAGRQQGLGTLIHTAHYAAAKVLRATPLQFHHLAEDTQSEHSMDALSCHSDCRLALYDTSSSVDLSPSKGQG